MPALKLDETLPILLPSLIVPLIFLSPFFYCLETFPLLKEAQTLLRQRSVDKTRDNTIDKVIDEI